MTGIERPDDDACFLGTTSCCQRVIGCDGSGSEAKLCKDLVEKVLKKSGDYLNVGVGCRDVS
jgi:hypothetical protein